jgi:uncharacterized protein YndB with AHSA1/START domain
VHSLRTQTHPVVSLTPNPNPSPAGAEIVNVRVFPANRDAVFAAFSDPVQLAQWWGPVEFTNEFHQFDFRVGGDWLFTMRGPGGAAYELKKRFEEIVRPGRIVLRHVQQGHDFTLTMSFAVQGAGTKVTWVMRFADPAEAERLRTFLLQANEQNFDRLGSHLSGNQSADR